MNGLPDYRDHRTALIIDVRRGITPEFENRYLRLLESVNVPGIMVDVYTLRDANGLTRGEPNPGDTRVSSPGPQAAPVFLEEWANRLGYSMLLVASPLNR